MISDNGIIEDSKFIGWGGVGATGTFCSDGERAENSTKQAELLGGYTTYRKAMVPNAVILPIDPCTRNIQEIHTRGAIVGGGPKETS